MVRKVKELFICDICGKEHSTEAECDTCILGHDVVYVGLERQEWKELVRDIVQALYFGHKFNQKTVEKLAKYKFGIKI